MFKIELPFKVVATEEKAIGLYYLVLREHYEGDDNVSFEAYGEQVYNNSFIDLYSYTIGMEVTLYRYDESYEETYRNKFKTIISEFTLNDKISVEEFNKFKKFLKKNKADLI